MLLISLQLKIIFNTTYVAFKIDLRFPVTVYLQNFPITSGQ